MSRLIGSCYRNPLDWLTIGLLHPEDGRSASGINPDKENQNAEYSRAFA